MFFALDFFFIVLIFLPVEMCLQDRVDFFQVDFVDPGVDPGAFATAFSVARFDDAVNKKNQMFLMSKVYYYIIITF